MAKSRKIVRRPAAAEAVNRFVVICKLSDEVAVSVKSFLDTEMSSLRACNAENVSECVRSVSNRVVSRKR